MSASNHNDSGESSSNEDYNQYSTKQVRIPILLVLYELFGFISCKIVFDEYVFNVDLCKILNENYKCEFETELLKYGDIFNGYYPRLYSTPIPRPAVFNFTNSRKRLREQLVLKKLFYVVYSKYDLDCDLNNVCSHCFNENCDKNGYYHPPVAHAPTSQIMIILNDTGIGIPRIDTGLYENDILNGVYGAVWDEINIVNGTSSGM